MTQAAARWSLQREGQYFKGTLLTPKPTASALAALQRPEPHQPLQATEVRFMILSSCLHSERLQLADWTWCSEVKCWAYLDADCKASLAASIRAVRVVTPREYLMDHFLPSRNGSACCEPAVRQSNTSSSWDGLGPSSFFCTPHRQLTFSAQYRFLPALAHGRAGSMAELKDGRLKWLVLVDDDSSVLLPRLLSVLAPYDDQARIQLGDFLVDDASSGAAQDQWLRPFACGGAGTVLSAGAARATDFAGCAMRYQHACLQSDWMIGSCLAQSDVVPVTSLGCGGCGGWLLQPSTRKSAGMRVYRGDHWQSTGGTWNGSCAFAQFHRRLDELLPRGMHHTWGPYIFATAAILQMNTPAESPMLSHCITRGDARQGVHSQPQGWPSALLLGSHRRLGDAIEREPGVCPARTPPVVAAGTSETPFVDGWIRNWSFSSPRFSGHPSLSRLRFFGSTCPFGGAASYLSMFRPSQQPARGCSVAVDDAPHLADLDENSRLGAPAQAYFTMPLHVRATIRIVAIVREPITRLLAVYQDKIDRNFERAALAQTGCHEGFYGSVLWRCVLQDNQSLVRAGDRAARLYVRRGGRWLCSWPFDSTAAVGRWASLLCVNRSWTGFVPFEEWVHTSGPALAASTVYAPQIGIWRRRFASAGQVLVLSHSALRRGAVRDTAAPSPWAQLAKHVGLRSDFHVRLDDVTAPCAMLTDTFRGRLQEYYRPHNTMLLASLAWDSGLRAELELLPCAVGKHSNAFFHTLLNGQLNLASSNSTSSSTNSSHGLDPRRANMSAIRGEVSNVSNASQRAAMVFVYRGRLDWGRFLSDFRERFKVEEANLARKQRRFAQQQHPLVFYNRVPKCGSTSLLQYIDAASKLRGFLGDRARDSLLRNAGCVDGGNKTCRAGACVSQNKTCRTPERVSFDFHQSEDFDASHFHPAEPKMREMAASMVAQAKVHRSVFERHVHFIDFEAMGYARPVYLNLLRDPVSLRTSSFYFYRDCICNQRPARMVTRADHVVNFSHYHAGDEWCKRDWPRKSQELCALDVNGCYSNLAFCERTLPSNALGGTVMIDFTCGMHPDCRGSLAAKLARAKANVRDKYAWVGILERLPESLVALQWELPDLFGDMPRIWRHAKEKVLPGNERSARKAMLPGRPGRRLATAGPLPTQQTIERMQRKRETAAEVELYEHAVELLECKLRCIVRGNNATIPQRRQRAVLRAADALQAINNSSHQQSNLSRLPHQASRPAAMSTTAPSNLSYSGEMCRCPP